MSNKKENYIIVLDAFVCTAKGMAKLPVFIEIDDSDCNGAVNYKGTTFVNSATLFNKDNESAANEVLAYFPGSRKQYLRHYKKNGAWKMESNS